MFRVLGILLQNSPFRHIIIIVIERQFPAQQGVENYSQTPNIDFLSSIFLPLEHFRRTVADCPAPRLQVTCRSLVFSCEAEIDQLDILMFVQENVFQLQVPVDAALHVYIVHRTNELREYLLHLRRLHAAMIEQVIV